MTERKLATSARELREWRAEAMGSMKHAIEALLDANLSETARELLTDQLRFAHEQVREVGLYEAFDGDDPVIEAGQDVIRDLFPLIEDQVSAEAGHPAPAGEQKEVAALNLHWMAMRIMGPGDHPSDKVHRWVGFIQGVLAVRGRLIVANERNSTRSIFHRLYRLLGFEPPASAEREKDVDKISVIDLKKQEDGEFHVIHNETTVRQRLLITPPADFGVSEP
jgi:hypothetical protein